MPYSTPSLFSINILQRQDWLIRDTAFMLSGIPLPELLGNAGMRLDCLQVLTGTPLNQGTEQYASLPIRPGRKNILRLHVRIERRSKGVVMTDAIMNWRRFLKRRNYSPNTVKNYLNIIRHFVIWVDVPLEDATHLTISYYIDRLMKNRAGSQDHKLPCEL